MTAARPPMGWNSWNTFGEKIDEKLIFQIADRMADEGYREAGYQYLIIDDCWALKERDEQGLLVPDPKKFPHGMKAVADYVHGKGLKFGMYSCAGVMTCAGYPSSYDHEFSDARQFAEWGVDYLKYDFCHFPEHADCRNRYHRMSMALKATGRDILFAACNWGKEDSWTWMRSIGAHTYRSTGDIFDNFRSFMGIFDSQLEHLCQSGPYCFNDMDMLTVGMYNQGNVAIGKTCTDGEYRIQFSLWCLSGTPLIIGADIREIKPEMRKLLLNTDLIRINQDEECRPPCLLGKRSVAVPETDKENAVEPIRMVKDQLYTFIKHLSNQEFVIAFYNLFEEEQEMNSIFADAGLPYGSGYGFHMRDIFTGEDLGVKRDYYLTRVPGHDCKLYFCRLEKC
ncbi:MAG: glycoside hydrolase family 27 protein [Lachnospiraceae bacterium]|nr:glycoside hydrolase family 27 protein [Lachnospiraceae bacterium]